MRLISGLLLLSLAMACGKKDNESETTPAEDSSGKLEVSELAAPANITAMPKASFEDEFDSQSYIVPHSSVQSIGCSAEQISQTKIVVLGNSLRVSRTVNTSQCYIDFLNGLGGIGTSVSGSASVYAEIVCTGVDVSSYNGTAAKDFDPNTICVNGYSYLENLRAKTTATSTVNGQAINVDYSLIASKSTADNQACIVSMIDANTFTESGCIEIETSIDTGSEPYVDHLKRVHKDLVWSRDAGSIWYTSGSMDLAINDWTGAITYTGASSSPSYTLSNGSESISGTFAASGLKALSRMKSPFSKIHR